MAAQKRSITITPGPALVNVVNLVKELAGIRVLVSPEEISTGVAGITLLYLSDAPTDKVEPAIRAIVAAHAPPRVETDAERIARLAQTVAKGKSPGDLSVLAISFMSYRGVSVLFGFCSASLRVFEYLAAKGVIPEEMIKDFPELVPYGSFKAAREAYDQLVTAIASGQFDPEAPAP